MAEVQVRVTRGTRKVYPDGSKRGGPDRKPIRTEPGAFRWHAYMGDKNVANGPVHGYETEASALAAAKVLLKSEGARIQDPDPDTRMISGETARTLWAGSALSQLKLWVLDKELAVATRAEWMRVIRENEADRATYRSERVDCDNFAMFFSGSVGLRRGISSAYVLDFSAAHAYCALPILQPDGTITIEAFEPQSDNIVTSVVGAGMYKAQYGVALWS